MYEVIVDYAPAYELVSSFKIFSNRNFTKNTDVGMDWAREISERFPPQFLEQQSDKFAKYYTYMYLLLWKCPVEREPDAFIEWLANLSAGEMFERLSPFVDNSLPKDLAEIRDYYVDALTEWNRNYFKENYTLELHEALTRDAQEKRHFIAERSPIEVVEEATCGIRVGDKGLTTVLLIPGSHSAPLVTYNKSGEYLVVQYAVDLPREDALLPPKPLLRVSKAFADENRLAILKYLSLSPRSFTEILDFIKLSKSAVHYHMVLLRAAGLVAFQINSEDGVDRYSIRNNIYKRFESQLSEYIG